MEALCCTAEDDGVSSCVLLSIKTSSRTGPPPAQYLFNVPEGFSRVALEHRIRPGAGLRAVFALGSPVQALGGFSGLLLRLKQDGHKEVQVIGSSGVYQLLGLAVAAFVRWHHPAVNVTHVAVCVTHVDRAATSPANGDKAKQQQQQQQGSCAQAMLGPTGNVVVSSEAAYQTSLCGDFDALAPVRVPEGCNLSLSAAPASAACCYEDDQVQVMPLLWPCLPAQLDMQQLPAWLTGDDEGSGGEVCKGAGNASDSSTTSASSSQSGTSNSDASSSSSSSDVSSIDTGSSDDDGAGVDETSIHGTSSKSVDKACVASQETAAEGAHIKKDHSTNQQPGDAKGAGHGSSTCTRKDAVAGKPKDSSSSSSSRSGGSSDISSGDSSDGDSSDEDSSDDTSDDNSGGDDASKAVGGTAAAADEERHATFAALDQLLSSASALQHPARPLATRSASRQAVHAQRGRGSSGASMTVKHQLLKHKARQMLSHMVRGGSTTVLGGEATVPNGDKANGSGGDRVDGSGGLDGTLQLRATPEAHAPLPEISNDELALRSRSNVASPPPQEQHVQHPQQQQQQQQQQLQGDQQQQQQQHPQQQQQQQQQQQEVHSSLQQLQGEQQQPCLMGLILHAKNSGKVVVVLNIAQHMLLHVGQHPALHALHGLAPARLGGVFHLAPCAVMQTAGYQQLLEGLPGQQVLLGLHTNPALSVAQSTGTQQTASMAEAPSANVRASSDMQMMQPIACAATGRTEVSCGGATGSCHGSACSLAFQASARVMARLHVLDPQVFPMPHCIKTPLPVKLLQPETASSMAQPSGEGRMDGTGSVRASITGHDNPTNTANTANANGNSPAAKVASTTPAVLNSNSVVAATNQAHVMQPPAVPITSRLVPAQLLWRVVIIPHDRRNITAACSNGGDGHTCSNGGDGHTLSVIYPQSCQELGIQEVWQDMLQDTWAERRQASLKVLRSRLKHAEQLLQQLRLQKAAEGAMQPPAKLVARYSGHDSITASQQVHPSQQAQYQQPRQIGDYAAANSHCTVPSFQPSYGPVCLPSSMHGLPPLVHTHPLPYPAHHPHPTHVYPHSLAPFPLAHHPTPQHPHSVPPPRPPPYAPPPSLAYAPPALPTRHHPLHAPPPHPHLVPSHLQGWPAPHHVMQPSPPFHPANPWRRHWTAQATSGTCVPDTFTGQSASPMHPAHKRAAFEQEPGGEWQEPPPHKRHQQLAPQQQQQQPNSWLQQQQQQQQRQLNARLQDQVAPTATEQVDAMGKAQRAMADLRRRLAEKRAKAADTQNLTAVPVADAAGSASSLQLAAATACEQETQHQAQLQQSLDTARRQDAKGQPKQQQQQQDEDAQNVQQMCGQQQQQEEEEEDVALGNSSCNVQLDHTPPCVLTPAAATTRLLFLGTGSAEPSKYRGPSAILLQLPPGHGSLLIDCGEGSWGMLCRCLGKDAAMEQVAQLRCIWISHRHVDHVMGLTGLLRARAACAASAVHALPPLLIAGPPEVRPWLQHLHTTHAIPHGIAHYIHCSINGGKENGPRGHWTSHCRHFSSRPSATGRPLPSHQQHRQWEQRQQLGCGAGGAGFTSWVSVPVRHCSDAYGLVLEHRDGWKLVYSGDTRPCPALIQAGMGATMLIHEATFEPDLQYQAVNKHHSTSAEALAAAKAMQAYRTILTHFSQRYPRVPAGLGLTEDETSNARHAEDPNTAAAADRHHNDDLHVQLAAGVGTSTAGACGHGLQGLSQTTSVYEDDEQCMRTSAIAFDGMCVTFAAFPVLPLLCPHMELMLRKPTDDVEATAL